MELKGQVLGFTVAVMNALDLGFGGKGNILGKWLNAMDAPMDDREATCSRRQSSLSPGAMAFFMGLPQTKKD